VDRLLRRDPGLAALVARADQITDPDLARDLLAWSMEREVERRSLAQEALERYRELNLLYGCAEQPTSLNPATVLQRARIQLERSVRHGTTLALLMSQDGRALRLVAAESDEPPGRHMPLSHVPLGQGIVGHVALDGGGEIVNDPASDPRASDEERALGAIMAAPLRASGRVLGVLVVIAPAGADLTAGEHRLLSAIAALTAPSLDGAMAHEREIAAARAREEELQRQLDLLRDEVEQGRREARVLEITGSDTFRALREQADALRGALEPRRTPPDR
jgi:GAF domain-containing protein